MKMKKLFIVTSMAILPTVTLISASCDNKTPKLDELKELINDSSVDSILLGVERVETPEKPENLEQGKKQVSNVAVKTYEEALSAAKAVNEESKASEAKTTLEAAINALKSAIVEGTKASSSATPNLNALKELIKNSSVETLLTGVEVLPASVTTKPAADTVEKGKKVILLSAKTTYEAALNTAKEVTEESKAQQAKKDLETAINALKAEIVVGNKISTTPNLDALKELINNSSVDTLLAGVEVLPASVTTKPAADTVEKGKKVILDSAKKTYETALNTAKAVTEESKALNAKTALEAAISALKSEIVEGTKPKKVWDQNNIEEYGDYVAENLKVVDTQRQALKDLAKGNSLLWYDYKKKWFAVNQGLGTPDWNGNRPPEAITIVGRASEFDICQAKVMEHMVQDQWTLKSHLQLWVIN
ncbi:hypothetical protein JN00_0104 [Metamycoplasma subdolum]|uniref:Lipoprotein n=1 Tax=Metamycoplasma subdolum TaxID=92407 RepID=A0A3M0A335_9BACT|nr:hypothetical protein [Metamycoplasma subdolum]RMA79057.1 hypothetical protein JN00_0104 [Metamycoplasma subdolum]WPB50580.1 hypothetical protein R9C05_00240 [Metamycoplasma subdolum]